MSSSYSVIIPALNEEGGIAAVIDRLQALSPPPEIIVVDDGSTDRTGEIAKSKGVTIIRHPASGGYGRSLKDGLRAATELCAIADADGTYPLERIPELIASLEDGYDMVVGARSGKHYRGTIFKMPARIVFKWLVEFTTGRRVPDINSGLRVFRKTAVLHYEEDLCNGFSFTTTITLIYLLTGKFVLYIPIDYGVRSGRSKVRIVRDSLRTLQYITEVIVTYNPLKLFVLMSGILVLCALLSLTQFFVALDPFFFLLLATIFLVGAFIVFAMGLLAHIRMKRGRSSA